MNLLDIGFHVKEEEEEEPHLTLLPLHSSSLLSASRPVTLQEAVLSHVGMVFLCPAIGLGWRAAVGLEDTNRGSTQPCSGSEWGKKMWLVCNVLKPPGSTNKYILWSMCVCVCVRFLCMSVGCRRV